MVLGVVLTIFIMAVNNQQRYKDMLVQYKAEFETYPTGIRIIGTITIFAVVILVAIAAIFSASVAKDIPR